VVVTTHHSKIEVLGTHFNVKAYPDEETVSATLTEGRIRFFFRKNGDSRQTEIQPGQKLVYDACREETKLYPTSGEAETAWTSDKVIFRDTPLKEALHLLARRYNVEFIIKDRKLESYSFTGTFTHQRLEHILEFFRASSHICWRYVDSGKEEERKSVIEIY
jgi:ferric-dicitrate binding protein FerR (iron transport regulator)